MIAQGVNAVLIKVAAMGLGRQHVGKSLSEMRDTLLLLHSKYDVHPCGEGGEYESLVLDCPLFAARIVLDQTELVMHSKDAFAPVVYLKVLGAHLEPKDGCPAALSDRCALLRAQFAQSVSNTSIARSLVFQSLLPPPRQTASTALPTLQLDSESAVRASVQLCQGYAFINGIGGSFLGDRESLTQHAEATFDALFALLAEHSLDPRRILSISLYLSDMLFFASINEVYLRRFGLNPPSRVCVQLCLPSTCPLLLDLVVAVESTGLFFRSLIYPR
jgi:diphthine-ammonia ligase